MWKTLLVECVIVCMELSASILTGKLCEFLLGAEKKAGFCHGWKKKKKAGLE